MHLILILDHFNKLSDEVILSILSWLPKKSLVTCALVCKRFLRLVYDEALWTRMDLGGRNLPPKSVGHIVSRGFRILRLAQAAVSFWVFFYFTYFHFVFLIRLCRRN